MYSICKYCNKITLLNSDNLIINSFHSISFCHQHCFGFEQSILMGKKKATCFIFFKYGFRIVVSKRNNKTLTIHSETVLSQKMLCFGVCSVQTRIAIGPLLFPLALSAVCDFTCSSSYLPNLDTCGLTNPPISMKGNPYSCFYVLPLGRSKQPEELILEEGNKALFTSDHLQQLIPGALVGL